MSRRQILGALAVAGWWNTAFGQQTKPREYPTPGIREEQKIVVDGVVETWQLKWLATPHPACEPSLVSLACPCTGFAYGEAGELTLVRLRNGHEIDRLPAPSFGGVIIQRWQPDWDRDFEASERKGFATLVSKRPTVEVMHFADYDHDGQSSEFYLQTEAAPCGKSVGMVVGISRNNPRLHVFGTASKPNTPLYMRKIAWEALQKASSPFEITDWTCGDHGADIESAIFLLWSPAGIEGNRREYECTADTTAPRRLIKESPL